MQFPNQWELINEIKCEPRVKVFNSSVEKRVEKNVLKMKSPMLRVACTHCTIFVQSLRKIKFSPMEVRCGKILIPFTFQKGISIPVRDLFQFNFDRVLILGYVVPLPECMHALADNLDQNFAYRNTRNLYGAVAVRLKTHLRELILAKKTSRCVEAKVNTGVSHRLVVAIHHHNF
jgi:hypothetical protein